MKSRKWLNVLAVLLIIVGIAFLGKNHFESYFIKKAMDDNQFTAVTVEEIQQNEEIEGEFDFDQTSYLNFENILAGYQSREDLPLIGGLGIPSIDLQLPIFKGLAESNLVAGAGTMTNGQQMGVGNYSLVGHNYARTGILFSDIPAMSVGDKVYITDMEHVYVYEISYLEMVTPDRVDLIEEIPGKNILTLITCSLDLTMRWVGQGELVEQVAVEDASIEMLEALEMAT